MKKSSLLVVALTAIVSILYIQTLTPQPPALDYPFPTSAPTSQPVLPPTTLLQKEISLNGHRFIMYSQKILTIHLLIYNYDRKTDSSLLIAENKCNSAINGGFYTTDHKPLGGLAIGGKEISKTIKDNNLLTGFLWKAADGKIILNDTPPYYSPIFLLQSGPLFNTYAKTNYTDTKRARRSFALSKKDEVSIGIIFDKEDVYAGPQLAEIPQVIKEAGIEYEKILNLDGGSASVFFSKELPSEENLHELTNVGSILCVW